LFYNNCGERHVQKARRSRFEDTDRAVEGHPTQKSSQLAALRALPMKPRDAKHCECVDRVTTVVTARSGRLLHDQSTWGASLHSRLDFV
jgi:hypothetical protein